MKSEAAKSYILDRICSFLLLYSESFFFSSQSHGECCNDTPKSAQHSSSEVSLALFCLSLVLKEPVVVLK